MTDLEVEETVSFITRLEAKRVALQLPDSWLHLCRDLLVRLSARLPNVRLFVLADTSFAACCVDEIAAAHANVDALVHYGPACLSPRCSRIPVHHVFGRRQLDVDALVACLSDIDDPLLLLYDLEYSHAATSIRATLTQRDTHNVIVASIVADGERDENETECAGFRFCVPQTPFKIVHVGSNIRNDLLLQFNQCKVCFFRCQLDCSYEYSQIVCANYFFIITGFFV